MSDPLGKRAQARQWSRRDVLRTTALALTAAGSGVLDPEGARLLHALVQEETANDGSYEVKAFTAHEWQTLRRLCDLILPADEGSGSASEAEVPEFIDLLASGNQELAEILTSGILWLDHEMGRPQRAGTSFVEATEQQQTAILDLLAAATEEPEDPGYEPYEESLEYQGFQDYTTRAPAPLAHGVRFFGWLRRLTVDGFYTSPMGIADVGYQGNGHSREYRVPARALRYALARSPFADQQ